MGFLSIYDGTRKVVLDKDRDYWVEIADHISQGDKEEAERCISKIVMIDGTATPTPDVTRYRQLLVVAAIKSWNLDDDNGSVWPVDLKHVQKLPGSVFDELWKEVDGGTKGRSPEEDRQFPAEDFGGGSDGDSRASDVFDVPSA